MDKFNEPDTAYPGTKQPCSVGHDARGVMASLGFHALRWARIAALAAVSVGISWLIGREASRSLETGDMEFSSQRRPSDPTIRESRTATNNETIMRIGWVRALDGTAIAYTGDADRLVFGGQFRTDLSLRQMAEALKINIASIADPRDRSQIDPDAVLFRAKSAVLTNEGKALSRALREQQVLRGEKPDAVVGEWVILEYSFTLSRLKHPSDNERFVLSAIIRAATEQMPKAGDQAQAVGLTKGEIECDGIIFLPGMLPPEFRLVPN
jgi:hypothetical protein